MYQYCAHTGCKVFKLFIMVITLPKIHDVSPDLNHIGKITCLKRAERVIYKKNSKYEKPMIYGQLIKNASRN